MLDPPGVPPEDNELRDLVRALAGRVAELEARARAGGNRTPALAFSDEKLKTIAEWLYSERLCRSAQFSPELFGEPAWDMLLDLFIQTVAGTRVSATSLCLGANVPQTTGLRYIGLLEEKGVVRRQTPPDDRRLTLIAFTPEGYTAMRRYLSLAVTRFRVPLPD